MNLTYAAADLESLATEAIAGDRLARERFVRAAYPVVFRWALVKTGDRADADDVCQEAMIRIDREVGTFDGRSKITTWMYRVTANTAVDLHRRTARHHRGRESLEGITTESDGPSVAEHIDANAFAKVLGSFFRELPEQQRTVFYLVDLQRHTPAEASEILDMNGSTVRAHLFKARRTIRKRILEAHPEMVEDRT